LQPILFFSLPALFIPTQVDSLAADHGSPAMAVLIFETLFISVTRFTIELKEMAHDKFHGIFVDVIIFPPVAEIGPTEERLVNGGHFKCRKIMNIFMP
jgi:hypothetical protein